MNTNKQIYQECQHRNITRLCHFTPSRNLAHIIAGNDGILATCHLRDSERQCLNATDLERLDGHTNYICCSIEYPNGWYFSTARSREIIFQDWVILLITPDYLWKPGARFCPINAASGYGRHISDGIQGFRSLYKNQVIGARGSTIQRMPTHLLSCPTDNQAEILIPDRVKIEDITGIVVRDEVQAANEKARLRLQGLRVNVDFYIAPALYDKAVLSAAIRTGQPPVEKRFCNGDRHG